MGQEFNQPGDDPQLDDLIDRRVLLPGQHSSAREDSAQPAMRSHVVP